MAPGTTTDAAIASGPPATVPVPLRRGARRAGRRLRIGVIDLVHDRPPSGAREAPYAHLFRKQLVSVMPQCVSAWCRRLGHRVHYASYFGQRAPEALLPDDLDLVFVSSTTRASGLAYALARLFELRGTRTVLGGPHARSFPADALRFFDVVVGACDEETLSRVVAGDVAPGSVVSAAAPPRELPPVAERMPEIRTATFYAGRALPQSTIPLVASQGCPYACDFCVDGRTPYQRADLNALEEDLAYLKRHAPGALLAYTDPNFGVRFDETLDAIERATGGRSNRYVIEASLSILRPERLERLARSGCVYVAPGVESWFDYGNKVRGAGDLGRGKLESTVAAFERIARAVPGVQANFIFGTDEDRGAAPFELTKEFLRRSPDTFPTLNLPAPYGGTVLAERLLREGRVLTSLPLTFLGSEHLAMRLAHYEAPAYYDHLIDLFENATRPRAPRYESAGVRFIHALRRRGLRRDLAVLRSIRRDLDDRELRAFHAGESPKLPDYYHHRFEQQLGPYAELLPRSERLPVWEGPAASVADPLQATAS